MDVAVIGMGIFGSELAKELSSHKINVLIVDQEKSSLEPLADIVTNAVVADITDFDALKELQLQKFGYVVVCLGRNFEASVLCVSYLKKLGVAKIIARTNSDIQGEILLQVGACEVILPEKSAAHRAAYMIMPSYIRNLAGFSDGLVIAEVDIPGSMSGKSLIDLDFRRQYGIMFIAKKAEQKVSPFIEPADPLNEGDVYIVTGLEENIIKVFGKIK